MEKLNEVSPGVFFTEDGLMSQQSDKSRVYTYLKNTMNYKVLRKIKSYAVKLHEYLCHESHADGCSWYYEIDNGKDLWYRPAHIDYLIVAYNCYNKHITLDTIKFIDKITSVY